jgi:hypothetical protein
MGKGKRRALFGRNVFRGCWKWSDFIRLAEMARRLGLALPRWNGSLFCA